MSIHQYRQIRCVTSEPPVFYALVEHQHAPKNTWTWLEHAHAYGPYTSEAAAALACEALAGRPHNDTETCTPEEAGWDELGHLLSTATRPRDGEFDDEAIMTKAAEMARQQARSAARFAAAEIHFARDRAAERVGRALLALDLDTRAALLATMQEHAPSLAPALTALEAALATPVPPVPDDDATDAAG